jgi:hypothetical protein
MFENTIATLQLLLLPPHWNVEIFHGYIAETHINLTAIHTEN